MRPPKVLPGYSRVPDEVQLGLVGVAAGGPVDDDAQPGDLVGVDLVPAGAHGADDLAGVDEHGQLVGVDDGPGELADVVVGPLEDDLVLLVVRYGNELTTEQRHDPPSLDRSTLMLRICRSG